MFSKKTIVIIFLSLSIVTVACTSALYVPTANQATESTSLAELQSGRKLYVQKCGGCHTLYLPEKYTKAEWQHWIKEMDSKVKMDDPEKQRMLKYLSKGI